MSLTSHAFLLLFLPISLLLYWRVFKTSQSRLWVLLVLSYMFYALAGWQYVPLLLGLSWVTFHTARRGWFTAGIVINLTGLAIFKLIGWESTLLNGLGLTGTGSLLNLALPLGLSYYTFKHISYLLDVKWQVYPASADFTAFATYAAFFPQISAGPLSSFEDTGKQLRALPERLSNDQVFDSLVYITIGLSKKLLIADILLKNAGANVFSPMAAKSGLISAWLLVLASAMGIYFDFSGYTDMVIGMAQLFGVRLPPNFNNPFLARDIQDFWNQVAYFPLKMVPALRVFPFEPEIPHKTGNREESIFAIRSQPDHHVPGRLVARRHIWQPGVGCFDGTPAQLSDRVKATQEANPVCIPGAGGSAVIRVCGVGGVHQPGF